MGRGFPAFVVEQECGLLRGRARHELYTHWLILTRVVSGYDRQALDDIIIIG
jgi:hypothetical protein